MSAINTKPQLLKGDEILVLLPHTVSAIVKDVYSTFVVIYVSEGDLSYRIDTTNQYKLVTRHVNPKAKIA